MVAFIPTINKQFIFARLAVIALFAGLFILSACGGGGPLAVVNNTTNNLVTDPCADNVFADDCLMAGEARRATALNTCRNTVQTNPSATCAPNIPAAAVTCFKDPFDTACDTGEYQAVLVRSPATPKLDTLMIARTQDCRTDTLTGDNLCDRAIDNTCAPAATGTGAIRARLVTDDLCNDVADYSDEREAFVDDCRGADESKKAGCPDTITVCAYTPSSNVNPFAADCINNKTYDIDRIVYCHAGMTNENVPLNEACGDRVTTYCKANLFTTTAGCLGNDAFDGERIADCTDGTNANLDRCKNLVTLTACFTNPFGNGCDTSLGDDLMTAQNNRATYCRGVAVEDLAMDTLCTGAVANFCDSREDANPFDMICRADGYDITRIEHCQLAMANDSDSFDPHTECGAQGANIVNVYCKANLFTTTAECLTNDDFDDERVDFCTIGKNLALAQCKNQVTFTVEQRACFTNPFGDGCSASLGSDLMTAQNNRATYCRDLSAGDLVMDTLCTGAITNFCDSGEGANPFDMICRDGSYDITRILHCQLAMVDDMDSFNPHTECGVGGANIVNVYCASNLFTPTAECLTNGDFDDERIDFCTIGTNVNLAQCKNQVAFTVEQRACFRNPFGTGCDTSLGGDLMTAQNNRESYCRGVATSDLEANALCTGAITNFCTASEFDGLCVADIYQTERETTCRTTPSNGDCTDTIAGLCSDLFIQTLGGTTENLCQGAIDDTTYEARRDVACLANDEADGSCKGTGGLIDVFCKANPFNPADDCMVEAYNTDRETLCLNEPAHGAGLSCGGIIAEFCIANPLRQTTQATPTNLCGAEYDAPREIACRAIAVAAVGTTAGCVDLVTETCTFVAAEGGEPASGNPYDTLCDKTVYEQDQTDFCLDSVNMMTSRCDTTISMMCNTNPFTTNAGMAICDETYAPDRLTRCRNFADSGTALPSGADCTDTIAGVCSSNVFDTLCADSEREISCRSTPNALCRSTIRRVCEGVGGGTPAAPFDALCDDDPLHTDLSYTNVRELVCIAVASGGATPDTADVDRCPDLRMGFCMNNPFDTTNGYCEDANFNDERESMCSAGGAAFGTGDCTLTITRICDTGSDIFNSICDMGYTQARIDDCTSGNPTNAAACDTAEVYGTICGGNTGNANTNPFDDVCASATPASGVTPMTLALARQAVVTFCNNPTNRNITANCMEVENTITDLNTDCVLVANTFGSGCDYDEYDTDRAGFCGADGGVDSFNPACQDEYASESEAGRAAFITLCRETRDTTGCDVVTIAAGVTIADCITNPYQGVCIANPDFSGEAVARTTLCDNPLNFYNDLCTVEVVDGLADRRLQYCATGAGVFSKACQDDDDVMVGDVGARRAFVATCRETRDAEGCATTNIDGTPFDSENPSVTVADCITNPYRVECYGTDDNRNRDFIVETVVRDILCSDPTKFFDPLCDGEVVAGVGAARLARCRADATTFDTNCMDATYSGTDVARGRVVNKCRAAEDATLLEDCSQVVATGMEGSDTFTRTVIDCIDKEGDPYQSGCAGNMLFDAARTAHSRTCAVGDNVRTNPMCFNALAAVACLSNPFGNDEEEVACDVGIYATPRTTYCSTMATTTDDNLCTSIKTVICTGTPMAESDPAVLATNPFAQLCGDPSVETPEQTAFCLDLTNLANNDNCAPDDATGQALVCPSNPFNDSFGLNDIDCTVAAYLPQRLAQCFDGTQTDATECDKTGIADVICRGTGAQANPFLAFCDGAQMAGYDGTTTVESVRTTFANTCASDNVGDLICANAKSTLCLATGDFARPFATACAGEEDIADIQTVYCRADTAWEAVCNTRATTDTETTDYAVIEKRATLLAACVGVVGSQPMYCTNKIADGLEQDLAFCVATPFADVCKDNTINDLLGRSRANYCTTPATSFHVDCNEAEYRGTDATRITFAEVCERNRTATGCEMTVGSVPIRDCVNNAMGNPYATGCVNLDVFEQQRIGRALDCAEGRGADCDSPVSGVASTITVAGCNTDPFAVGCDGVIFANARRDNCIAAEKATAGSSHADCSVAEGQGYTNYVQGGASELELGDSVYKNADELAIYMEDDPQTENIDESVVYVQDDDLTTTHIDERLAYDGDDNLIDDDPTTPIDESRARVFDDPRTARDESRVYIGTTFNASARVRREGIEQGGLTLRAIGGSADSGFAYAYIPGGRGVDGIIGTDRYYAGLLSGTDVGTPLVDNTADGAWHGRLAIVNGYGGRVLKETADFVLTVNFTNKTIDSGDVAVLDGLFNIDGRFTTGGVIYGVTSFRDATTASGKTIELETPYKTKARLSSRGSVTGVIGVEGAVGAFISSGEGVGGHRADAKNTFGEYAGGFVASPAAPDPADSCLLNKNLFKADCIVEDAQYYDICVITAEINSDATTKFCTDADVVARYIARETACASADLNDENHACAPVIAQLCDFNSNNIFNTEAGTGATKFDCTSVTRYDARRTQICSTPAYFNGAVVEINGVVSRTDRIPACFAITEATCTDDPFTQTIERNPTNLCDSSYNTARETECAQAIVDSNSRRNEARRNRAPNKCFDTILTVCRDNPFNADLCYSKNGDFRSLRVSACIANPSVDAVACPTVLDANCPTDGRPRNSECISDGYRAWEAKFNTVEAPIEASIPDGETQNSRILLGGIRGLDTKTNVASIRVAETFLRFNSRYTRIDTGERVTRLGQVIPVYDFIENDDYYHGVSFFSATTASGQIGHYAGILSGTQVGAPLADSRVGAQWHGQFGMVSSDSDVARQTDFVLNVDFSTRTISADDIPFARTVSLDYPIAVYNRATQRFVKSSETRDYVILDRFSLTAVWDAGTGVFTGTTKFTTFVPVAPTLSGATSVPAFIALDEIVSTGVVTGIIGVDSAVGVFTSDETQAESGAIHYAGGFYALPSSVTRRKFNAWVGSFDGTGRTNADGDVLLAAGDFTRTDRATGTTYFIEGLATGLGLATGGDYAVNNQDDSAEIVLRLDNTDGEFGYSGVAFWSGTIRNDATDTGEAGVFPIHSYGGLLSDTDVGAFLPRGGQAIPNGVLKLVWTGQISGIFNGIDEQGMIGGTAVDTSAEGVTLVGKLLTNTDFKLLIDYTAGTIATLTDQSSFLDLILDGRFDANGVISGDVTGVSGHGDGRFNGLIGVDGVVGVFKSNAGAANSFIGGFTATAPVRADFAAWTASFGETGRANTDGAVLLMAGDFTKVDRPADSSYFIEAGTNRLGLFVSGAGTESNVDNIPEHFLRLDDTTGVSVSGVAFWSGPVRENAQEVAGSTVKHFYAGLLSGTDAGLPLPQGIGATFQGGTSATWTGTIGGVFGGDGIDMVGAGTIAGLTKDGDRLLDANFQLLVDYGARTIKTPVGKESFGDFKFSLDGTFDGGVMRGTFTSAPINDAPTRPAGLFSGLIGQDAAVGVFKSDNDSVDNNGYIGGFVATLNKDVKALNWVGSFDQTTRMNTAGDVLLAEDDITATNRPTNTTHFITGKANGLGLTNGTEHFLRLDRTTGASGNKNGVAFWGDEVAGNITHFYAGLLSGTQVGLPLSQGAGVTLYNASSATWTGTISGIFTGDGITTNIGEGSIAGLTRDGNRLTDTDFQLLVDYGARTIKTPVGKESFGNLKLSLDGTFDGGIMAGAVAITPTQRALMGRSAGRFSGVIGTDGTVGVFKSDNENLASYIGGFVAELSRVQFSNWTDSFDQGGRENTAGDVLLAEDDITLTDRPSDTTYFITGKANGLGVLGHALNVNNASSRFLRLDGTTGATGDSNGIAFWGNLVSRAPNAVHLYAGLLSGTDVGLTLPRGAGATFQGDSSAVWTGTIRGLFAGTPSLNLGQDGIDGFTKDRDVLLDTNFELLVNYGTGALTTPLGKESFGTIGFGLNGSFDGNGVMTGDYTTTLAEQPEGRFGGIIGTEGAVGVFKSSGVNSTTSIVGGFVAKPPAP